LGSALDSLRDSLALLDAVDTAALDDAELHDGVVAVAGKVSQLEARLCRLLREWDERELWGSNGSKAPGARFARETHMPQSKAKRLVSRARRLASMPQAATAYEAGEIVGEHVDLIATCNRDWANAEFSEHEELLVNNCRTAMFEHAVKATEYWKQLADPDAADDDGKALHESRRLSASQSWRGLVELSGTLDPIRGEEFLAELNRVYEEMRLQDLRDGVERTPAQRRADALVEMARRSASMPADAVRPRTLLTVTIGIEPFNRLCETAAGTVIAPGLLMPLPADADIERIVYDPPNRKLEASERRRFTGAVRRIIEVRDRHCQHPSGCSEPVANCDVDHIVEYADLPFTCVCGGELGCRTHNRIIGTCRGTPLPLRGRFPYVRALPPGHPRGEPVPPSRLRDPRVPPSNSAHGLRHRDGRPDGRPVGDRRLGRIPERAADRRR
jgi:hypothetical protein